MLDKHTINTYVATCVSYIEWLVIDTSIGLENKLVKFDKYIHIKKYCNGSEI